MRALATFLAVVLSPALAAAERGIELGDLDRAADPCVDFFQYANGGWRAKNPIPADMPRWSRRWQAGEQNKDKLKEILDEVSRKRDWPAGSTEQLIGDFYGACMDEARINELGTKPLAPLLGEIDAMKTPADVAATIRHLHEVGIAVPFAVVSTPDMHDPKRVIADVLSNGLGLPDRDYYSGKDKRFVEARDKYRAHLIAIFKLAGDDEARAKAEAGAAFKLEAALAAATLDRVARRDPHSADHLMPVAALKKLAPHVEWDAYFDEAKLSRADLNVAEPKFMKEVDRQLVRTPLADWKSYLRWQVLHDAAGALSEPFVKEQFAFFGQYLQGASVMKPRWKRCVEDADDLLGEALGKKYVEKYFPPAAKARVLELVENLRLAMKETIDELDWMTPATKKRALEKLATFRPKIGYPDRWNDYAGVEIKRDSYYVDRLNAARWAVHDDRGQIGKPVEDWRWGITTPTSDAYYSAERNEIVFPAGILQPPAFDLNAVDAVNYGAIGVVIGHEFSHGFDDQGAKFDANGRLDNWWTPTDLKQFQKRGQCVANQFEHYEIEPGIHHKGGLVLGESIGDLAGAKIAYRAYQIAQRKHPAANLDGFTPDQQFFIAWGQFRGDETRPEMQRLMVQSDPHPVAKFRVIGPLSNLSAFQKAFQCKAGAPMVRPPGEQCVVW